MKYLLFVLLIATPAFAQTYLESALTFVPDDFIRANFSNWELIRADLGVTRADLDAEDAYAEFARIVLEERIDLNRYGRW
ncbi:MAG: hypothetical protein KC422_25830, partial [Trueperaceae bacterium]|nr:hypothetical protein [Trueperaceae bacterium]